MIVLLLNTIVLQPDVELQWKLTCARFDEWIKTDLFTIKWWFMIFLFAATSFYWWKSVDKSRLNEIIFYTAIIIIFILILDELGLELTLWDYTSDLFPLFPPISAINLSCIPMVYSLIYQYFMTWKSFITSTVVMAVIFCFICEPFFVWIGVYQMLYWRSYYGFPIYILLAVLGKIIVIKVNKIIHA